MSTADLLCLAASRSRRFDLWYAGCYRPASDYTDNADETAISDIAAELALRIDAASGAKP